MSTTIDSQSAVPTAYGETDRGARLHYVDFDLHGEWDSDGGEPVVLIHGLGCSWQVWRRQTGWLAHTRRVVAPDVRGSGQSSSRTSGWTTADMAADIHELVVALGLDRPAVVGISMGGTIALQYAADYPDDISRLVVMDTFAGLPDEAAAIRDDQLHFIETHTLREIAEERMARAFTENADPRLKAWMIDLIASGDIDGYRSQARATLQFSITDRLGEITVPTTVLHGGEDRTAPSVLGELLAQGIASSEFRVMDGQGHFPNLEAPAVLNPLLADALGVPSDLVPAR
jgi:3-oxoadipate enol-lactonase